MSDQETKESGIMAAIRNYMMGHGGFGGQDDREYDVAMGVDPSTGTAKGYAMGGVVEPDLGDVPMPGSDFDVFNQSSTMKTAGSIPPPPISPVTATSLPPAAALIAPSGIPAAPPQMPMRPQPSAPGLADILSSAQSAGNQLYGSYAPENRNALYAYLAQRANGMPNAVGGALASAGDAIARGYGRDQTNFLDKTLQGEQEGRKEALDAFDVTQKGKLAETSAGMEIQKMDPNSAISKVSREAYALVLGKLGYGPQALSKMNAANVETVAKVAADLGGKEMESLVHQAQLIVESQFHKQELGVRESEIKSKALDQLASHPVSSMLPTATNQALKAQAGLQGPTTGQAGVPPVTKTIGGKSYVNHNGQWYEQ